MQASALSGCIGAELSGIDLAKPLTDKEIDFVEESLAEHLVVFFRN